MLKKLLGVALVLVMVAVFAAPASAADFSFGGWYRLRAIAANNQDRLDTLPRGVGARDNVRYVDSTFFLNFDARQDDNVQGFVQIKAPEFQNVWGNGGLQFGDGAFGGGTAPSSGTSTFDAMGNLYWIQFKVPFLPGPWFVRAGLDDIPLPKGIIAFLPFFKETGFQLFGNVGPDVALRGEAFKRGEGQVQNADDDSVYTLRARYSGLRNVSLNIYEVLQFKNRTSTTTANFRDYWSGLSTSGRYGRFNATADFVYLTGDWEYGSAGEAVQGNDTGKLRMQRDQKVNAWVIWLTGGVTLGPVNLTAQYLEVSGDNDQEDNTQNQFYGIGCQTSDSFFVGGCDARVMGPTQLWFGHKDGRHNGGLVSGSRDLGGNTGGAGGRYSRGNGNRVFAFDSSVKVMRDVTLNGTLGFIWSQHARPDLSAAGTNPFVRDTYIGSEIDLNVAWTLYPGFLLEGDIQYLAAGDYGILRTKIPGQSQVTGASPLPGIVGGGTRMTNANDDSWQAMFTMQWFF